MQATTWAINRHRTIRTCAYTHGEAVTKILGLTQIDPRWMDAAAKQPDLLKRGWWTIGLDLSWWKLKALRTHRSKTIRSAQNGTYIEGCSEWCAMQLTLIYLFLAVGFPLPSGFLMTGAITSDSCIITTLSQVVTRCLGYDGNWIGIKKSLAVLFFACSETNCEEFFCLRVKYHRRVLQQGPGTELRGEPMAF